MKKYWILSLVYAGLGLGLGVYYREFTKMMDFAGKTSLAVAHPHMLILGAFVMLLLSLYMKGREFEKPVLSKVMFYTYNIGLVWTVTMMVVRGTLTVLGTDLGSANAAISGIAGIGHIALGTGLILLIINVFHTKKIEEK